MKFTLKQFEERYPNSDACLEEIKAMRFSGFVCNRCGKEDGLHRIQGRPAYHCSCGKQIYPLVGTIFENSRVELRQWFLVMYLMSSTKSGVSAKQVERITGMNYKTCWRMMKLIRGAMGHSETSDKFSGEIETDETFFAPKPARNTRIRKPKRETVIAILERSSGTVLTRHVPKSTLPLNQQLFRQYVRPRSTVYTDGHLMYPSLLGKDYDHRSVTHWSILPRPSRDFSYFTPSAEMGTQTIENFFGVLKRGIKGTYIHVSPKYLQLYTQEYAWRYSHRKDEQPLFEPLLKRLLSSGPTSACG